MNFNIRRMQPGSLQALRESLQAEVTADWAHDHTSGWVK